MVRLARLDWLRQFPRACVVGLLCLATSGAGTQQAREYAVKAAFVYNLLLYVNWPEASFASPAAPIVVGVVGKDPFGADLNVAFNGKRVNGRGVLLKRFASRPPDGTCNLLFFAGPDGIKKLGRPSSAPVLTVGECPGFAESGGMVQMKGVGGKTSLVVNLTTMRGAGLDVSSRLLKVVTIVGGTN